MRVFKPAFTIAELAISIAIIGVVASMLMPQIVNTIQKKQAGPILGRAVEQIVLGNQNIIQMASMDTGSASSTDVLGLITEKDLNTNSSDNYILTELDSVVIAYWGLSNERVNNADVRAIREFQTGNNADLNQVIPAYQKFSKFPAGVAIVCPNEYTPIDALDDDTSCVVYIDTTGWDRTPNICGKDIFAFHLMNNGNLKPFTEDDANNGLERTRDVVRSGFKVTY